MTAVWHLYDGRERQGPIASDEVERRYAAGTLDEAALVWMEGWPDWRPVGAAVAWLQSQPSVKPEAPSAATPVQPAKAPLRAGVIALAIVALAIAGVLKLRDALDDIVDIANPSTIVQSYLILVWGLAAGLAAVIAPLWWLCGRIRKWRPKSMAPGLARGVLAICALLATAYIALQLRLTPLVHEIAAKVASQVATVGFRTDGGWITIQGNIGPHLADQVSRQLQGHPDAKGILIDSLGGLTTDALRVARLIEQRGLDVRVERRCVSACIGILVSGRHRTAEWNAQIALHALAPTVDRYPTFLKLVLERGRGEFEGYLTRRGIPKTWIDEAEAVGPGEIRPTPPPDLLAKGVLTAVTLDGVALDPSQARWLWLEAATGNSSGFAEVLEAIRTSAPEVVNASGDELYSSMTSGDPSRARQAMRAIVTPLIRRAQLSAGDDPTYLYLETKLVVMARFTQQGAWDSCADYLDGRLASAVSRDLRHGEQLALAALIRSAGRGGWRAAGAGPGGAVAARQVSAHAAERMAALNLAAGSGQTPRARCLRLFYVLQGIDELGPQRGAGAWRVLIAPG